MKKGKFDYQEYISTPPQKVEWVADDEFEIVVGTARIYYKDIMDMAGQFVLKRVKFHLKKKDKICKATTLQGEENLCLTDEQEMKLNIVMNNIEDFFLNYAFTPESFCKYLRYLMRPLSITDKVAAKRNYKH